MFESVLSLFAPMLVGTLSILTIILIKGEICPGQRGRLHKLLPAVGLLWLAVTSIHIEAFIISATIIYFFSQVQTGKTREIGPVWVLYLANLFGWLFLAYTIYEVALFTSAISWLSLVVLLGAVFSHLLLLVARCRLVAFHRLLPIAGMLSGILLVLSLAFQVMQMSPSQLEGLEFTILAGLALLVFGLLVWPLHIVTNKTPSKWQLSVSFTLLLLSGFSFYPLMV